MNTPVELTNSLGNHQSAAHCLQLSALDLHMLVRINRQQPESMQKPIAAFTSKASLEAYIAQQSEPRDYVIESIKVDYNPKFQLDSLYLSYTLNEYNYNLAGYYINRFEAQRCIGNRGFIRSIPLFKESDQALTIRQLGNRVPRKRGDSQLFDDLNLSQSGATPLRKIKSPKDSTIYQMVALAMMLLILAGSIVFWLI